MSIYNTSYAEEQAFSSEIEKFTNASSRLTRDQKEILDKINDKGLEHIKEATSFGSSDKLQRYVFISLGMPEQGLISIISQAKQYGFIPILRGFKEGSYKKTVLALEEIIKKTEYGIVIDPELFKEFDIEVVPTFVIVKHNNCARSICQSKKFNKLSGNVSVKFALETLLKGGEAL